ncbi:hypothetical protein [Caulobacter sp. UC70_42]|uniref:hypothetical protein n=1 Tax=Caulobacter sp. UC70_42 TaxID=3374551 RepID=UPI0037573C4A
MAKDEFAALMNDPLFKRLSKIAQEVYEGRADPETARAWFELRAAIRAAVEGMNDMLEGIRPKDRSTVLRRWIEEFVDERMPPEPVLH